MDKETAERCAAICDAEAAKTYDIIRRKKNKDNEATRLRCRTETNLAWLIRKDAGLIDESVKPQWLVDTLDQKKGLRPPKRRNQFKGNF